MQFPVSAAPAVLPLNANVPAGLDHPIDEIWLEQDASCPGSVQRRVRHTVMNSQSTRLSLVVGNDPARDRASEEPLPPAVGEVLIMSAGASAGPISAFRRIALANLRPGVRHKVLFPDSARMSGVLSSLSRAGAEVRTDIEVPMEALVIDRKSVVLPADRSGTGHQFGVTVLQLPGVVTATVGLFERIWQAAVPLTPSDLPDPEDPSVLTGRERDLLVLLCAGSTDVSAAVKLGISVRTVGRMVADIMNRLGARSRFEAGAKAVDRGWLPAKAG
jgi:DNA-binding CsgD family transcriptional regulator